MHYLTAAHAGGKPGAQHVKLPYSGRFCPLPGGRGGSLDCPALYLERKVMNSRINRLQVSQAIFSVRGHNVLSDESLAALYGVDTRTLVQAVRRNRARFPRDFMFQLTRSEWANLRSRIVISSRSHGGRRYPPYVFTEQGVAMLSSVLRSKRAIAVNVEIMRVFVRLRGLLASNAELARRFEELETRIETKLGAHDEAITAILAAIRALVAAPPSRRRGIGFTADLDEPKP